MQGNHIQHHIHIPGTLAANVVARFTAPFDMTLEHVSAVGSNNNDATLALGTSADDDAYLVATAIGDSGTPAEFDLDDFVNDTHPHILKGTVVVATLDFDGATGTAAQNVSIVLTFGEG